MTAVTSNRNEQWKQEKDGLDIFGEIEALSGKAFSELDPGDVERLKWAGIYAQRPRDGHFLVRVKLPSGTLSAAQAEVLADLAHAYGRDEVQITIRQAVQIHNITLRDAVVIRRALAEAGLSSVEACGDVPRTILGNPLMGVDPEELLDTTPLVEETYRFFLGNRDFSNLPRKFKVSISANPHDAGFARINDLAFVPARRAGETGFHAYVGGGLSAEPYLAQKLPFFIRPEEVLPVARAVATLFRDEGYREKRNHCRLKYLVADLGIEAVAAKITAQTGTLEAGGEEITAPWQYGRFYGVHAQKQPGLSYVGVHLAKGHIEAADLRAFAGLAKTYGTGRLRTTNSQNLILLDIPAERLDALLAEELFARYPLQPGLFSGYASSCTGNAYCNFAPIETKDRLQQLTQALDAAFPAADVPVRINLTGCFHSCAQPQIADIGLTGGRAKVDGEVTPVYTVQVGGSLGPDAAYAQPLAGRVADAKLFAALRALVAHYFAVREVGEAFHETVRRTPLADWQAVLAPYLV
ncbi:nitrite/sulfite reductase [uncultured Mitsuokella sp.]|uniref:nitrite/sulfite reductase n=1 Tax=uncultured Mitsuokella sp. TaxID=453120 RepID=UPI0026394CA3|nr:ferredoxin--nitrite reductase [uncultured Mitsuokella sp.]